MAKTPLRIVTPAVAEPVASSVVQPFIDTLVSLQAAQLAALLSWQEALFAIQNELWDEWACRWAGGVPIDA
jgi:hypothetical protein